ncbi:MAG: hypothetical protein HXY24_14280 [Rubrivivax sp.]|nr:hypothetical protein [Rubrivivax sp.]
MARALRAADNSPITSKIDSVTLPWASSLKVDENLLKEKNWQKTELLITSNYAGSEASVLNISPDQKLATQDLGKKLLAVALSYTNGQNRIIIVGDADFLGDQNIRDNPGNFGFGLEAISWLSQESVLSQIKVKNLTERKFVFNNQGEPSILKFGNMAFALITVAGYGSWRLWRRRRMRNKSYLN